MCVRKRHYLPNGGVRVEKGTIPFNFYSNFQLGKVN